MFSISNHVINQVLVISLLRFLFIGGGLSFLVGIGLIFRSELMMRIFNKMNYWVGLRHHLRIFDVPRDSWFLIVRYRFVLSALITVGAMYAVAGLMTPMDTEVISSGIGKALHLPGAYVSWLLMSVKWFLLGGCVLGIVVGLMLAFSLNTLSKFEKLSAIWVPTCDSDLSKKLNDMHLGFDSLVMAFPKTAGLIVAIMSMVEMTLVGMQMF